MNNVPNTPNGDNIPNKPNADNITNALQSVTVVLHTELWLFHGLP